MAWLHGIAQGSDHATKQTAKTPADEPQRRQLPQTYVDGFDTASVFGRGLSEAVSRQAVTGPDNASQGSGNIASQNNDLPLVGQPRAADETDNAPDYIRHAQAYAHGVDANEDRISMLRNAPTRLASNNFSEIQAETREAVATSAARQAETDTNYDSEKTHAGFSYAEVTSAFFRLARGAEIASGNGRSVSSASFEPTLVVR